MSCSPHSGIAMRCALLHVCVMLLLYALLLATIPASILGQGSRTSHSMTIEDSVSALCDSVCRIARQIQPMKQDGTLKRALTLSAQAYEIALRSGSASALAAACSAYGCTYSRATRWEDAILWYKRAVEHFDQVDDSEGLAQALCDLGDAYRFNSDLSPAMLCYQRALPLSRFFQNSKLEASIAFNIAVIHQLEGRRTEAIHWYAKGASIAEAGDECLCEASCRNNLGALYASQGKYDSTLIQYKRALAIAEQNGDRTRVLRYRNNIALTYHELGKLTKAEEIFQEIFEEAAQFDLKQPMFEAYYAYANILRLDGRFEEAVTRLEECLSFAACFPKTVKFRDRAHMLCYNALGDCYLSLRNYAEALKYYRKAGTQKHYQKGLDAPDPRMQMKMGGVYARMHRYTTSKTAFRHAISHFRSVQEYPRLCSALLGLGNVLERQDSTTAAMQIYREVLTLGQKQENPVIIGKAQLRISRLLREEGRLHEAKPHIIETMRLLGELETPNMRCDALCLHAALLAWEGKLDSADVVIQHAKSLVRPGFRTGLMPQVWTVQESIAQQRGQYRLAYSILQERTALEDSIATLEQNARYEHLFVEHEAEMKEQEISRLQVRQSLQEAELSREATLRNAIIGGTVLLIIIGLLIFRRMRDKRRAVELKAEVAEAHARTADMENLRFVAEAERREREAQQRFARGLLEAQENERKRLAGELHDSLGQDLIVIKNQLLLLRETTNVNGDLDNAIVGIGETLEDVRRLSRDLRPYQLDRYGIGRAIEAMVARANEAARVRFTTEISDVDGIWDKDAEACIYRIVQEGVSNILKHADAGQASIRFILENGNAMLVIADDGKGFVSPTSDEMQTTGSGFGLRGMAERAEILGGSMSVISQPGQGTTISITLSLPTMSLSNRSDTTLASEHG